MRVNGLFSILLITIVCSILNEEQTTAQELTDAENKSFFKGWDITPAFLYGKIIKHTPNFQPTINENSRCFEIAVASHTHGKHNWESNSHYPFIGFAASANILGNDSSLGNAFALYPYIEIPLVRGNKINFSLRLGSGIAYLTKHYDEVENPINNVIPAHFNNITQAAFSFNWKLNDNFTLLAGNSLTHYSSGAVRLPNLGINIHSWRVGIRITPKPYSYDEYVTHPLPAIPKKIFLTAQLGLGFQELGAHNGPMYHVYGLEFSASKILAHWNVISIGIYGNYKESSNAFIKQQELYADQLFLKSSGCSAFFKDDFTFGNIGIPIYLGYYFYAPSPLQIIFFQKLGWYYSFPIEKKEFSKRINAGVYVTAGDFTADFVSVECGFRF